MASSSLFQIQQSVMGFFDGSDQFVELDLQGL
jgi:hypothetical protein